MKDAWGIRWTLATRVKDVTPEEIKRETAKYMPVKFDNEADNQPNSSSTANTA